uniref:DNA 5'-3' helicase n=1 Tax=viral metagenome TaxID=1070528 RepID=A0A6M3IDL6_9ZZZZ
MKEIKLMPQATEFERAIIGAILFDPQGLQDIVGRLRPEYFYDNRNRKIITQIIQNINAGVDIDLLILHEQLKGNGIADNYYSECVTIAGHAGAIKTHLEVVTEKYWKRELYTLLKKNIEKCCDETENAENVSIDLNLQLTKLSDSLNINDGVIDMQTGANLLYDELQWHYENKNMIRGIMSGYYELDSIIDGFSAGDYCLMAGCSSMGKSTLMLNIARNIAEKGKNVGIITLESNPQKLLKRLLQQLKRISVKEIKYGNFIKDDLFAGVSYMVGKYKMYFWELAGASIARVINCAKYAKSKYGIDILFIDHIGCIREEGRNRYEAMTNISGQIKALPLKLYIPVVALCQLSRQPAHRENKRPLLSDLRDTGALEQDADKILFLFRQNYYLENKIHGAEEGTPEKLEIICAKNRDGETGNIDLKYYMGWYLMEEFLDDEEKKKYEIPKKESDRKNPLTHLP